MSKLKPWARGPFELIRHAEGHMESGKDFDRRMALISYDNAIEAAISTYLRLHPSQRGGKTYPKDAVDDWLKDYLTKLDFLEKHAREKGTGLAVSKEDVIFYHKLRNETYHAGTGTAPDKRHLNGIRKAALSTFSTLFGADAEAILEEQPGAQEGLASDEEVPEEQNGETAFSIQMTMLDENLRQTLEAFYPKVFRRVRDDDTVRLTEALSQQYPRLPRNAVAIVANARTTQRLLATQGQCHLTPPEFEGLVEALVGLNEHLRHLINAATGLGTDSRPKSFAERE